MTVEVREAGDEAERAAAFRLRYDIYARELGQQRATLDHEAEVLVEPEDADARILVGVEDGRVIGTLRILWGGDAPFTGKVVEEYDLSRFADATTPEQLVVFDRFMLTPEHRGTFAPLQFLAAIGQFSLDRSVRLTFCWCQPHLLNLYTGLGFRTYRSAFASDGVGLAVPLVFAVEDRAHLEAIGSPLLGLPVADDYDPAPADDLLALLPDGGAIEAVGADAAVRLALDRGLLDGGDAQASLRLLTGLAEEDVRELFDRAFALRVEPGDQVVQQDTGDRTMFVVLEGGVAVRHEGRDLVTLGPGEVFGELAFLTRSPRTADVVATAAGARLLALNERVLQELVDHRPAVASRFHRNLARVVAEKLVATQRSAPFRG